MRTPRVLLDADATDNLVGLSRTRRGVDKGAGLRLGRGQRHFGDGVAEVCFLFEEQKA